MAGDEPKKALLIFQTITEEIMDSGKAQLYHHAADWLRRVRSPTKFPGAWSNGESITRKCLQSTGRNTS